MANYWAGRSEQVTLLTLDRERTPFYPLHPAVKHCPLGLAAESRNLAVGLLRNLYRIWVLRRAIRESLPEVIVSFMDKNNVLTLLATRGLGVPVVISERTDPSRCDIGGLWNLLRRLTYPRASALVCQSTVVLDLFCSLVREKGKVIPNPVTLPTTIESRTEMSKLDGINRLLVAMGRLVEEKGFDLLLRAFKVVSANRPDWSLVILGEGPLREELKGQIKSLGLSGRARLLGQVSDPFSILRRADLFVGSSRFEGFPNALCEAMACGLPAVSFDCPSGPREIIRDGVDGVLVPPEDVDALADTLGRLMGDPKERERLARRAPEVLDRFSVDKVMEMWNKLIEEVTG
jgi:glycosyltransferase involved in cell wall biosynthesis